MASVAIGVPAAKQDPSLCDRFGGRHVDVEEIYSTEERVDETLNPASRGSSDGGAVSTIERTAFGENE